MSTSYETIGMVNGVAARCLDSHMAKKGGRPSSATTRLFGPLFTEKTLYSNPNGHHRAVPHHWPHHRPDHSGSVVHEQNSHTPALDIATRDQHSCIIRRQPPAISGKKCCVVTWGLKREALRLDLGKAGSQNSSSPDHFVLDKSEFIEARDKSL